MPHLESATRSSACAPLARWLRGSAAILLTLAAPAVSTWSALTTGHTGLTHKGIVLVAASLIGAAAGMLVAARRGQPVRPGPWPGRYRLSPGRTATTISGQARAPARRKLLSSAASSARAAGPSQAHRARRRNPHSAAATPAHQRHPVQTSPVNPAAGSGAGL